MESRSNGLRTTSQFLPPRCASSDAEHIELTTPASPTAPHLHIEVDLTDLSSMASSSSAPIPPARSANRLSMTPSMTSTSPSNADASDTSDLTRVESAGRHAPPGPSDPPFIQIGPVLGGAYTASPTEVAGPGLPDVGRENTPLGERSEFVGDNLDPDVQVGLQKLIDDGLRWILPSTVADEKYERPAGWIPLPTNSLSDRPPPYRMHSGPFNSGDELDAYIKFMPRSALRERNWHPYIHPSGNVYFENRAFSAVTDDFLRKDNAVESAQRWAMALHTLIEKQRHSAESKFRWPDNHVLYIQVIKNGDGEICSYYLVDEDAKKVFWLHAFPNYQYVFKEMPEPATAQLVELCLTHQFWRHKSSFPHGPTVEGSEEELRRMLTYFHIEMETCPNHSVSPFLEGQPARLIGALNWCKEQSESSEVLNWTIAELTSVIYIHACLTSFGELGVLMDRRQPPFEDDSGPGRPRLSKVIPYCMMHLLVLGGDAPYMEMIRDVTVGHYIAPQPWQDLMKQLVASRNKINIIAALILGANVSFLTIQGLQEAQSTISMMSALLSLASLVVGIQQERLHERLLKTTAVRGSAYFYRAWISRLGYRGVALTYALPTALLSWAIITLVAPILLWTFQNIAGDWIARSIIIGLIVVLLAVVACSSHFINHLTTSPAGDQPRKKRCMMSTAADYVSDRACTGAKWVGYGAHVCWRVSGHRGYKWIRTGIRCLVRRVCGSEEELPQPATAPNARAGP